MLPSPAFLTKAPGTREGLGLCRQHNPALLFPYPCSVHTPEGRSPAEPTQHRRAGQSLAPRSSSLPETSIISAISTSLEKLKNPLLQDSKTKITRKGKEKLIQKLSCSQPYALGQCHLEAVKQQKVPESTRRRPAFTQHPLAMWAQYCVSPARHRVLVHHTRSSWGHRHTGQ